MYKPLIFGAAMTFGCALFALAATTWGDPHADQPSLEPSPDAVRVIPPEAPIWVPEPQIGTIDLPEVVITAAVAPASRSKATVERKLRPCSHWRAIGPTYVDSEGNPSGERSVRELCE